MVGHLDIILLLIRLIPVIRGKGISKNLKKSIDILLHIQLKGAPSLALSCSAAGEPNYG